LQRRITRNKSQGSKCRTPRRSPGPGERILRSDFDISLYAKAEPNAS
jgi:hypothetical protein